MTALYTYFYIVVDTQRGCHTLKLEVSLPIDGRKNVKNFAKSAFVLDRLPS